MWQYASELEPELEFLNETDDAHAGAEQVQKVFKLNDADYEECLRKMNSNVKKHRQREQKKYEVGRGVRTRNDRVGESSSRYGTERERYNGRGGGRVFKWYSRVVFNTYLARLGVSETTCTERQCMLALRATSDELEKYPMVKDNLHAYAGPQCFPHLDPKSPEYRVHANQKLKTESVEDGKGASAADKQQVARAAVVKEQCWLQC